MFTVQQILPFLKGYDKDYSSNLVVFPGRRPSHFLRKRLARDIQTGFIPPTIFSMDEFVDFVFKQTQSKRNLETLDAISILYDIHKKAVTPLGNDRFLTPDSFFPIGLKIHRDLEELAIYLDTIHMRNFKFHVNSKKNDFAAWIKDAIKEPELAERLNSTTDYHETMSYLLDFI